MAEKINTILVDDEKNSLIILEHLLKKNFDEIEIIGTAQNVKEAIKEIDSKKPDLVFLDISMPDGEGFDVISKTKYNDYKVIFVTAYDQYAIKAFEVAALHYILKPVKTDDLKQAIERFKEEETSDFLEKVKNFMENAGKQEKRLILSSSTGMHILELDDIMRCESSNNYTTFYLTDGQKIVVSKPIQLYEQILGKEHFCRIHNKHIVNLKYIKKYVKGRGGYVVLKNGTRVDVSDGRKKEFVEKMNRWAIK